MSTPDPASPLGENNHIHIIGIGGAGMSAIARLLLQRGVTVSGSDRQSNGTTRALQSAGATIYEGHAAKNIAGATTLFISSAVKDDNPEIAAAKIAGLPILTRREFFKYLLPEKTQIAVAGTHGKTTTTALIIHLLREMGQDPSYIVGGMLNSTGDNAHVGQGSAFVVEADEYGGMFLGLSPHIAVITNIEHDHPDIFPTLADVMRSFREFVALLPNDGLLIACDDDPNALTLAEERRSAGLPVITYGITNPEADWSATLEQANPGETVFTLHHSDMNQRVVSALPGTHNILNTLAALAAVYALTGDLDKAIPPLATFAGTGRRFELMGQAGGVSVLSDYAHHPTAIRATLQATRQRYPQAAIWAVWQPHTYSRTRTLADSFVTAFPDADHVLITDIYAAREKPTAGDPTGSDLAQIATLAGHSDVRYSGDLSATAAILQREVHPGDVVIIFSAGDAPQVGASLLDFLRLPKPK
ncbi:MAG: UDP-N-acetylmuramate--L-alanine ligase [Chloroflexota bacterium]